MLCHGFRVVVFMASSIARRAGYHVIAPGSTRLWDDERRRRCHTQFHMVGDLVGLVAALGQRQAVVVGHDWGAPVAWNAALWRPDIFRAVAGLSVPFSIVADGADGGDAELFGDRFLYFCIPDTGRCGTRTATRRRKDAAVPFGAWQRTESASTR